MTLCGHRWRFALTFLRAQIGFFTLFIFFKISLICKDNKTSQLTSSIVKVQHTNAEKYWKHHGPKRLLLPSLPPGVYIPHLGDLSGSKSPRQIKVFGERLLIFQKTGMRILDLSPKEQRLMSRCWESGRGQAASHVGTKSYMFSLSWL